VLLADRVNVETRPGIAVVFDAPVGSGDNASAGDGDPKQAIRNLGLK
jgi:hypothetical protein